MEHHLLVGILLILVGGAMQGSFTLPMKFTRTWQWENIWLVYTMVGLLLLPWLAAAWTIPPLLEVYRQADIRTLALALAFGAGWGAGSVLFGLGVDRVGMALGFAIILGLTASVGSLVPMLVLHPEQLTTVKGQVLILGLIVVVVGLSCCARAGYVKQAVMTPDPSSSSRNQVKHFGPGLLICVLSGILSPMLNFSLAFGEPIAARAIQLGTAPASAPNAIWAPALSAGFVINAAYCVWRLSKNMSWRRFSGRGAWSHWLLGISMGALWMGGISIYGMGTILVGTLGTILGWPVFMAAIIIMANMWGVMTGEWRGAGRQAQRLMATGVVVLIVAVFIIGYGSAL